MGEPRRMVTIAIVATLLFSWLPSIVSAVNSTEEVPQRCGSCWCAPGNNGTCPSYSPGISSNFSQTVYQTYASFDLLSTPLTLATSGGNSNCYPFADIIAAMGNGGVDIYPEATYQQCAAPVPDSTNTTVCAYKFTTTDVTCIGRTYELVTYSSAESATSDGAYIVHRGACGVCSDAQDLSVRMARLGTIATDSVLCGTSFIVGGSFSDLQSCFENLDFTSPCALLWAHYTATSGLLCVDTCFSGLNYSSYPPPTCDLAPCLNCSRPFAVESAVLGGIGITVSNAGIVEGVPRPCSAFTRIKHDPCVDVGARNKSNTTLQPRPTRPPQATRPTSAAFHSTASWFAFWGCSLLLLVQKKLR